MMNEVISILCQVERSVLGCDAFYIIDGEINRS